jgi:hypothetical protein
MSPDNAQAYAAGYRAGRSSHRAGWKPDPTDMAHECDQWHEAGGAGDAARFEAGYYDAFRDASGGKIARDAP